MMTTRDIIQHIILKYPEIETLNLIKLGATKDLKGSSDIWSERDEKLYQQALLLRKNYSIPFWSAIMTSMVSSGYISENSLSHVSLHNVNISLMKVNSSNFQHISITDEMGINSCVRLSNGLEMHIPMLDFRVEYSDKNTLLVRKVCSKLIEEDSGYLLCSGKSYHYIGNCLLDYKDLVKFLGKALLYSPIVDDTWIAHQLIEGSCTLRLGRKNGVLPVLCSEENCCNW